MKKCSVFEGDQSLIKMTQDEVFKCDKLLHLSCGKCKDLEITIGYGSHFFTLQIALAVSSIFFPIS